MNTTRPILFLALCIVLVLLFVLNIITGSVSIPFGAIIDVFTSEETLASHQLIIIESRLPTALTAILSGAALALSGMLMQTFFRNPLAGPYILGISSGAGLGVALLVMGAGILGITISSSFSIGVAAMLGSLLILLLLFLVSIKLKDSMTLLIFGVMLGSIATAVIGVLQFLTSDYQLKSFLLWTLGSLEALTYQEINILLIVLSVGIVLSLRISKPLNAFLIGENFTQTLGINITRFRFIIIILAGMLAGVVTAFCGPIGFVGIVVPHFARLLFKTNNHLTLVPATVLLGANVLLFSNFLSNVPSSGIALPINSITSIIGIPFILWLLFSKKSISKSF